MQLLIAILLLAIPVGLVAFLVGMAVIADLAQRRGNRCRIIAEGKTAAAVISKLIPGAGSVRCRVVFSFQAEIDAPRLECKQNSTLAAIQALGLGEGSQVQVRYLTKWPRYAFIDSLVIAERLAAFKAAATTHGAALDSVVPTLHFISYVDPKKGTKAPNAFRWTGGGDITLGDEHVRFTAQRSRPFWFPKVVEQEFALAAVSNVEVFENAVRCEISGVSSKPRALQFWAPSPEEARTIAARLPASKTPSFAPQLAERAAFQARLIEVTPRAPVTPTLIGINVILFVIAAALGGGIFVPNGEVLIRLGSDFTPLTASGQWWRLLTSTFLHFGLLHLAFNMWALWVNGVVAERLYGGTRYLVLYLVAGVSGSVASFLWHPFVNGAGASGAIFGVLGAMLAYFLRADSGIPKSVLIAQRRTAAVFIVVSILNASRVRGIDNAAHLGGLTAGFLVGFLLYRPLYAKRDEQDWAGQWFRALATIVGSMLIAGYYIGTGQWHPRVMYDPSGRPILPAEIIPPPHTLGGVTLGMTSAEVLIARGKPVREQSDDWTYYAIDSAHDGALDVYFKQNADNKRATVWGLLYWGEHGADSFGMPNFLSFTSEDLIARYGSPAEKNGGREAEFLYFKNGLLVELEANKVRAYGVYTQGP